jgi:hypothetical protein
MNKIKHLLTSFLVISSLYTFAGASESNVQFQFTNISINQDNWDFAFLQYNVNDLNTGEAIELPSYLINYEIKDKTGDVLSKGSGIYMNIADSKMGSEEEYTIVVSTVINGQKVTHTICKKASPKKFSMKVKAGDLDNNNLAYTFTRPKFKNPGQTENIRLAVADVQVNVTLNNTTYTIQAGSGHQALVDQPAYQNLTEEMKKLEAEGRVAEMTIVPRMIFKGQVYSDNQTYYQVTVGNITEVSSLDATASK